jgi:LAO/AO transport system kinase
MNIKDPKEYIDGVLARERRVISKTITLIESSLSTDQEIARAVLDALLPSTGNAVRLGITGVPGVGKSTFISSRSGGSVMADKTRMEKLSAEKAAFIRPSPSGGTLGGVARKTRESMLVCEAAGFDVMIIETVGVGQSEATVASMVDFFMVLMLAGAGDELQGIKRGVLELADAIAINKADGDNVEKAKKAAKIYENALSLLQPSSPAWTPPVLTCSALKMTGIKEIWQTVLDHRQRLSDSGELAYKRRKQALDWMWSLVEEGLKERFYQNPDIKKELTRIARCVENGTTAPTLAARELLLILDKKGSGQKI